MSVDDVPAGTMSMGWVDGTEQVLVVNLAGELDDSEVPSPLRRPDDPPIVAPLVRVGEDHYVAFPQHCRSFGLLPQNAVATDRGDRHLAAMQLQICQRLADAVSAWRQHHCVQLLVLGVAVADQSRIVATKQTSQHRVTIVTDVTDGLHDTRHGHVQQQ